MFYPQGIKIVPMDLSLLTPLALAHWIMQDGSFSSGGLVLCTDSFYNDDTLRLANYLSSTYSLVCTTPKAPGSKGRLRIFISAKSMASLRTIVLPYMHSSF